MALSDQIQQVLKDIEGGGAGAADEDATGDSGTMDTEDLGGAGKAPLNIDQTGKSTCPNCGSKRAKTKGSNKAKSCKNCGHVYKATNLDFNSEVQAVAKAKGYGERSSSVAGALSEARARPVDKGLWDEAKHHRNHGKFSSSAEHRDQQRTTAEANTRAAGVRQDAKAEQSRRHEAKARRGPPADREEYLRLYRLNQRGKLIGGQKRRLEELRQVLDPSGAPVSGTE